MMITSTPFNRFETMRQHVAELQRGITRAQTETTTGRLADPVAGLGEGNATRIAFEADSDRLMTIANANTRIAGRLSATQAALDAFRATLDGMTQTFTAAVGGNVSSALLAGVAEHAVSDMTDKLNTQFGSTFVFGGIATDRVALSDTADARVTLETEFQAHFGFPVSDSAVATISADDLATFLDTVAEPVLTGAAWSADLAHGSGEAVQARIDHDQVATVSVTAQEIALRTGFVAAFLVQELAQIGLNDGAMGALASHGLTMASSGAAGVAELQGHVGLMEERLAITNDRILAEGSSLRQSSAAMVAVDPFEAASAFSNLVSQLETAYTLTGRLQQLSLMRFIGP